MVAAGPDPACVEVQASCGVAQWRALCMSCLGSDVPSALLVCCMSQLAAEYVTVQG